MLRLVIVLGALVVAAWCVGTPHVEPLPVIAQAVATEGVRAARMDDETFRARWRDVADMPPMREVIDNSVLLVSTERPPLSARRVSLHRADICARHGMRRVQMGKRWRCRR